MPDPTRETLRNRLRRGPLPAREAIYIAKHVARGLVEAHGRGIVHCDIQPANLILSADGAVGILDSGIARLGREARSTWAGAYGTSKYRSPEQERGDDVDASSDVWSLGIVLYEMLIGRLPGGDQYGPALAWTESAELIDLLQEEAPELESIISRMLAWRPTHRYPDAAALLIELDRLEGQPWAQEPEIDAAPITRIFVYLLWAKNYVSFRFRSLTTYLPAAYHPPTGDLRHERQVAAVAPHHLDQEGATRRSPSDGRSSRARR